jgi:putative endonuclease
VTLDRLIMSKRQYCVYIMTNKNHTVLYTGVTNNLQRRVLEHQTGTGSAFTKKYNVHKLIYFECGDDVNAAIFREKQIKAGSRKKKLDLINSVNPQWKDLFEEYFGVNIIANEEKQSSNHEEIASGEEQERPRNDTIRENV